MPLHNSAHLSPKALNYTANGSGRDTYIGFNCGGLLEGPNKPAQYSIGSFRTKTQTHSSNNFLPPKHVHYYSDGSGRDKYILVNEGGLIMDQKRYNFLKDLRLYQRKRRFEKNDYFYSTQFLPSINEANKQEQLYKSQQLQINKLAQPKQKNNQLVTQSSKQSLPGLRRIY